MELIPCCFCEFRGTERSVRSHMARRHPQPLLLIRRAGAHGRPPKDACGLCGAIHDDVTRPGWAIHRKKLERPRTAFLGGKLPKGHGGRSFVLGRTVVPPNVTRVRGIAVWADGSDTRLQLEIRNPDTGKRRLVFFEFPRGPMTTWEEGDAGDTVE